MPQWWVRDKDGNVRKAVGIHDWGIHFENIETRRVGLAYFGPMVKARRHVSTVFLGIDHGFGMVDGRAPVLYETMVFGVERMSLALEWKGLKMAARKFHEEMDIERYCTEAQARRGHLKHVLIWAGITVAKEEAVKMAEQYRDAPLKAYVTRLARTLLHYVRNPSPEPVKPPRAERRVPRKAHKK